MYNNKKKFNDLLKEREPYGTTASYPAQPLTQNNHTFFLLSIPAYDIFPYCYVNTRQDNPQEGFQRNLSKDRAIDIASYLDNSNGSIPTNIVLSAQDSAELNYDSKNKTLKYLRNIKGFLVIDGQHRLYGYGLTKKNHRIPVAIYNGLSRQEEAGLFIDINTTQRGVPAALLLDIKQLAEKETNVEIKLRIIFDKLNNDSDSPFCGCLAPSQLKKNMIARPTFNRGVKNILIHNIFDHITEEKKYELIKNYFKAVESALKEKDVILKTAYFEAFCDLFTDVITVSYSKYKNYFLNSLINVLLPISNIDFSSISYENKSRLSKLLILPILKSAIIPYVESHESLI